MDVLEPAAPHLQRAQRLMFEVAQVCENDEKLRHLNEAMEANRDAQTHLFA